MAAHQASPSLGFSRQEHWNGLPIPSPMHESEKWKWSRSVVSDSSTPWTAAYQASTSMGFSRQKYGSGVQLPSPTPASRSQAKKQRATSKWGFSGGSEVKDSPAMQETWVQYLGQERIKDWCWSSDALAISWGESTHQKRPWCWERLSAGGEEGDKGWDGWMASPTWRTWVWASSGR